MTDVLDGLADGAPQLWPGAPNNVGLDNAFGDREAVEAAPSLRENARTDSDLDSLRGEPAFGELLA